MVVVMSDCAKFNSSSQPLPCREDPMMLRARVAIGGRETVRQMKLSFSAPRSRPREKVRQRSPSNSLCKRLLRRVRPKKLQWRQSGRKRPHSLAQCRLCGAHSEPPLYAAIVWLHCRLSPTTRRELHDGARPKHLGSAPKSLRHGSKFRRRQERAPKQLWMQQGRQKEAHQPQ